MLGQLSFSALAQQERKLRNRLQVQVISNAAGNAIVKHYHYLRRIRTGGRQLTYGVMLDGELVGVIVYASATFHHKAGLTPPLEPNQIIELARLWLNDKAPKHSESCALGKSIKAVKLDWDKKYNVQPKAIISFSDLEFGYEGIIYQAANFEDWGFASMARFADAGQRYSRTDEGYGVGHYTVRPIKDNAPRSNKTKRCWVYWVK